MRRLISTSSRSVAMALLAGAFMWGATARAYDRYSVNDDATNCRSCHGDFRDANYISAVDGMDWGNLHNLHRTTMLNGDCDACHSGSDRLPVLMADSDGGSGLSLISCMGCHGRNADNTPENPSFPNGLGAGLRQHHHNAGATVCADCHDDADPANYSPVGEHVLPDYYANPGVDHPAMPTSACNGDDTESFAGALSGLDNDGDLAYDEADSDCATPVQETTWGLIKASYR